MGAFSAMQTRSSKMAPGEKPDIPTEDGRLLAWFARRAVEQRLEGWADPPIPSEAPASLSRPGAAFVTLRRNHELRGCMGTFVAHRPLIENVQASAVDAAVRDPRFDPIERGELDHLTVSVSVLGTPEFLSASNEDELLAQIVPGEDGLIVQEGPRRGTLLPAVWEKIPDPHLFLEQLKMKAGLAPDHWSPQLSFARYRTQNFVDPAPESA